eukprot:4242766-Lingulodinium_polyedra.AAC.1
MCIRDRPLPSASEFARVRVAETPSARRPSEASWETTSRTARCTVVFQRGASYSASAAGARSPGRP